MTDFDDLLGAEPDLRSEKAIQNETLVELTALPGTLLFRNNTGQGWQGKEVRLKPGQWFKYEQGMKVLRDSRPVRFGLEGSGDIMGVIRGRPLAVEVKDATGRQRKAQEMFERAWVKAGGIYVLARSPAEAKRRTLDAISIALRNRL